MDAAVTGSKKLITFVVMMAALMALIDITIVNVALNDIRASFATPIDQIGWVLDGLHDGEHRRHPDDRLVPAALRLSALLCGLNRAVHRSQRALRAAPGT